VVQRNVQAGETIIPRGRRQAGFSLIEILVSAAVTGVVATSAFYFLSSQNTMGTRGNDLMRGVNLGKLKMDSLKVVAYDSLSAGSDTVNERYIRAWHIGVLRDGAGSPIGRKSIELSVFWPLTGEQMVSFASLKSDDKYKEAQP
jgi:prepilin-type N-terminal cleavage/methylation domain-containing protein